jgi:fatty-acyl-CoA synthase/long-chain acyl-CoA synthetase
MSAFSSTEAGGTHGDWREPWELRATTCGRPYDGITIEIRDPETGQVMPAGEAGEIFIHGWWTMNGYFKQPDLTARTKGADNFVRTGDRALLDESGYLHFLGRYKNMLRVGGENVAAEEIESMLLTHPKVKQAAVIGIPDARLTEVPMAIVELVAGAEMLESEIISYCAERMANFRVPRAVRFTQGWPMTGSGKIQRHLLAETFLQH